MEKSRFTEFFIQKNDRKEREFKEWIFHRGMLFDSSDKWWGDDEKKRSKPHEGLDLCLYKDHVGNIKSLDEKTKIPAMYNGIVVSIINDFLGKSLVMEHSFPKDGNQKFYTIYGHTKPKVDFSIGRIVKQGEIIGALAPTSELKTKIFSHLHISAGYGIKDFSYDKLNWNTIADQNFMILIDPLPLIEQ